MQEKSYQPTLYLQNNKDDSEYFDELAFAEMMRQIINAIEELPANMSTILKECFLEGKSIKRLRRNFTPHQASVCKEAVW